MKVPINFSFPRWIFRNPYRDIFDFLGGGAYNRCRDARECQVGGRPLYQRLRRPLYQSVTSNPL